ncbi:tetratricopeptide repeat protein [Intestinibacter sp.]|uniref:tetratricopeptide repeat protein n=1 Tax=Intestinibacter sp. TaxID=1965304 RepID=UPI002A76198B|nr:tetratricopeptide repeat protein [Intestinibacter sp.]MDY2736014.1 tetratricopeptide repeat protein [Intestinibacter sp.]
MKIKYLIILIVVLVFSVGCNREEDSLFKEGQKALENHEYYEAQKYLSDVLEEDPKNESARSMYMQAMKMSKAEKYKDKGLYDKAIECLERIVNIDNGSQKIRVESNELKKELEKLQEEEEEASNIRKQNAKEVARKDMQKAEAEYYAWKQNQDQNNWVYNQGQGDSSDRTILDTIKDKINEFFTQ